MDRVDVTLWMSPLVHKLRLGTHLHLEALRQVQNHEIDLQENGKNAAKESRTQDRKQRPCNQAPRQCTHFTAHGNSGLPAYPGSTNRSARFLQKKEGQLPKMEHRFSRQIEHFRAKSSKITHFRAFSRQIKPGFNQKRSPFMQANHFSVSTKYFAPCCGMVAALFPLWRGRCCGMVS
jgi:hypothetical protein